MSDFICTSATIEKPLISSHSLLCFSHSHCPNVMFQFYHETAPKLYITIPRHWRISIIWIFRASCLRCFMKTFSWLIAIHFSFFNENVDDVLLLWRLFVGFLLPHCGYPGPLLLFSELWVKLALLVAECWGTRHIHLLCRCCYFIFTKVEWVLWKAIITRYCIPPECLQNLQHVLHVLSWAYKSFIAL